MFGIIRPCRNRLSKQLREAWLAHLCGLCHALRDQHGQFARVVTNYDGLVISVLVEAQSERASRRTAGPCPLRAMLPAKISIGSGAELAAAVSLVLASAKVRDHAEDGDGAFANPRLAGVGRRVATRWARQGASTGDSLGFDTTVLTEAVLRQGELERGIGAGDSPLLATEPTETATAAAFSYTAVLAGRPGNADALAEAGRLFGRVAHLLDAVEDLAADRASGAWNPLLATGTDFDEARRLCDDAVLGVRLALKEVEFTDQRLAHALLVHELEAAVERVFAQHADPTAPQAPDLPRRNWFVGCGIASFMFCTGQMCCRKEYNDPWDRKKRQGFCHRDNCCTDCCADCCGECGCRACEGGLNCGCRACCRKCDCDCDCC
ncbi:DUF5685 family protein [Allokutzneria sp. A3M-2-11 16]|uniref:DUF5685 family protein n=1 Tax=Allokutzneria sp. A3M-2-11 16 TaxID=2962043 RepID=UPI0020B694CD|nr:DUF5685 family protein [Allokutzneria sp. A3M-2-11 16]MCP3802482.1 DUF5685 family protein [Allokutzneria sp. A3M-2-11 16]